jgi:thioredoxin reductase (NADPH)
MTARELVIVGAGPAGVSAALWAKSLHLDVLLLEGGEAAGGQLFHVHFHPRELPGLEAGDGRAIAATYARQLAEGGIPVRYGVRAQSLETGPPVVVVLAGGERIECRALLITCGARRRTLGVPGEDSFAGRGLSYSATRDRAELAGKRVAVIGGGDAAFENALLLTAAGCDVTVVARGTARARSEFQRRLAAEPRARLLEHTRVLAIEGDDRVRALRIAGAGSPAGGESLPCEGVVVKVGVVPNTEWCRSALEHDAEGWLRVDGAFATSAPGVWAAGDVVRPALASVPVAAGHGALAVAAIRASLRAH